MVYTKLDGKLFMYSSSFEHIQEVQLANPIEYQIDQYKGNFHITFQIIESLPVYQLYYNDILFSTCTGYMNLAMMIAHFLEISTKHYKVDGWFFENKVPKKELTEFFQYLLWDTTSSELWLMEKINKEYMTHHLSPIKNYCGNIIVLKNHSSFELYYQNIRISRLSSTKLSEHSLKFIMLMGIDPLVMNSKEYPLIQADFENFKNYIFGQSSEELDFFVNTAMSNSKGIYKYDQL